MSTTNPHDDSHSRSTRQHRSYRDKDRSRSKSQSHRIPVPASDVPSPQSPQFERQPSSPKRSTTISRPKRQPRKNSAPVYDRPPLPSQYSHGIAHHVATGQVGLDYGPYQYHQGDMVDNRARLRKVSPRPPQQQQQQRVVDPEKQIRSGVPIPIASGAAPRRHMNPQQEDRPMSTPNTATVPQYVWENDKQPDHFHDSDPLKEEKEHYYVDVFSGRGWMNMGALVLIAAILLFLFMLWPILDHYVFHPPLPNDIAGVNASGQVPQLQAFPSLIDPDTPEDVYERTGNDGKKYELVFSDEFNEDGRSFYPGDDPYWEAADLHYWATNNLEWYDPQAATTNDGKLVLTLYNQSIHDLDYMGGMITSWNKLCFTTGYVEVSVSLPGSSKVPGLWPGAWSMGNLGRAGYGATTEGMWPYAYDSCDVGTFPNQTTEDGQPAAAVTGGNGGEPISYLPGQRVSACTCPGHDHPGPSTNKGRGVPEIDIIEAQIDLEKGQGEVSQSYQIAPYDYQYYFTNSSPATVLYDESITEINTYRGGPYQQAVSVLTLVDPAYYEGKAYTTYGYEYFSNPKKRDEGFITWYSGGEPSWHLTSEGIKANPMTQVNNRLITEEPMYLILNLGMSNFFQTVDFDHLSFPVSMYVDYVRVYQRKGTKNGLTCNPPDYPTYDYIQNHINAYTNPNLTTWSEAGYTFPRNALYDGCE